MRTIWGFDLGVASVGWAAIRWEEEAGDGDVGRGEIVRLGVRVFPESREEKGDRDPRNVARRAARLARRQTHRRRWRRVALRRLFAANGLLPAHDARPPAKQDPYDLRRRGLTERLAPHDLGWALFHLLKRRGWQGSRKHDDAGRKKVDVSKRKKEEKEEKEAAAKRRKLADDMGDRKLGEYLASIATTMAEPERRRDRGQTRVMVTDEFAALWQAQQPHHPDILTETLRADVDRLALFQRPTFFRRRTIGACELEPAEERALKAEWLTQQFEMLQLVNALRLDGGNRRGLDEAERARAVAYLESAPAPTWAKLRAAIGLPRNARFTHEAGKQEAVHGNRTEASLRATLGPDFPDHPAADAIRASIARALYDVEYRSVRGGTVLEIRGAADIAAERARLAQHAVTVWGVTDAQGKELAAMELPSGHGRHSLAAMRTMLPSLEQGLTYAQAREQAYAPRESTTPLDRLPGPNPAELKGIKDDFVRRRMTALLASIRNPTVLRTLGELQKIANALLRSHGRPDLIRLELARELKQSMEDRLKIQRQQRDREKARTRAREKLRELGKAAEGAEGADNVLRLLLWQEQGMRCPYSGESIGCAEALDGAATQIDHIFPRSRSFDDSQANKVLCLARENRAKGNRTPHEYLGGDADRWSHLTQTLWPQMEAGEPGWPKAKHRRCLREALEQEGDEQFTRRQLQDSSFIATAARDYLGLLFGGGQAGTNAVQPVPGRATALLRRAWNIGLGQLLHGEDGPRTKTRDDHRHHAVDALAVALTTPWTVQQLSRWWAERERRRTSPDFALPWPSLRAQASDAVAAIVVSHRVEAKLSGALHDAQPLGMIRDPYQRGKPTFVIRKKVQAGGGGLSAGEIERIVDDAVRKAIQAAVEAADGKLDVALGKEIRLPTQDGRPGPVIRRVRVRGPKQDPDVYDSVRSNSQIKVGEGGGQFRTNQALHHIALIASGNDVKSAIGLKKNCLDRVRKREGVWEMAPEGEKIIFTLCRGDAIERTQHDRKTEISIVVDFYRNGQIFLVPHYFSGELPRSGSKMPTTLIKEGWRKVSVDPIGNIRPAK